MNLIGKNIKKIRNVKGLSQQAFADVFSLSRGNISSYEEFRAEPKIEMISKIANYFGIPLSDFIEKELSVNELLHYNTQLVVETEKLKIAQQLVNIPYIPTSYVNDYIEQYQSEDFILKLPHITVPNNSKFKLLAIELYNQEILPSGFNFRNGDILIYEKVVKENVHRIEGKLGMKIDADGLKLGVYEMSEDEICLSLNEWVKYIFDIESNSQYWILRASYIQE